MDKKEILELRESLVEMYKAGFLDAYLIFKKNKSKAENKELNDHYKKKFYKRFGEKINRELVKNENRSPKKSTNKI